MWRRTNAGGASPLVRFAAAHGLTGSLAAHEEWPETGWQDPPEVAAIGRQVVLHCAQTISMPRLLGAFLYGRGGRVDVEIDHGHERTVVELQLSVPWQWRDAHGPAAAERAVEQAVAAVQDGPLRAHAEPGIAPAIRPDDHGGRAVAVVLGDLVAGVRAVQEALEGTPVGLRLRVFEAPAGAADPLAAQRPR